MLPSLNPNSAQKKKKNFQHCRRWDHMERTAPSGGLHVKYVAGVLTVDKPFLRITQRAQWRRQESWIAYQLLQGFRCQICWEHPLCFPDIRQVLLREISVWTSLSFMNPLGKTKTKAIFPKRDWLSLWKTKVVWPLCHSTYQIKLWEIVYLFVNVTTFRKSWRR